MVDGRALASAVRSRVKAWIKDRARLVGSTTSLETHHRREVVLTFDDGPDPLVTPRLLDVLSRHGATATFFVLLDPATHHPDLVDRIEAAGHEIALHGLDHRRVSELPAGASARWLRTSRDELARLTGRKVQHFRPPHGAQSLFTWTITRSLGMRVILWSGTTWDWKDVSQEERIAKALENARPGTILLAHDGAHHDRLAPPPASDVDKVDLLEQILTAYAERDLRCVSLRSALESGASHVKTVSFSS